MFHFNTVTRVTHFEHDQHAEGYDHCYDCTAEAFVLKQYLMKVSLPVDPYFNVARFWHVAH
eukprot:26501-Eustigmatos_ZCMA.PRE.1